MTQESVNYSDAPESDDGVLFVAQIDSNCGTMLHGLFSCLFS